LFKTKNADYDYSVVILAESGYGKDRLITSPFQLRFWLSSFMNVCDYPNPPLFGFCPQARRLTYGMRAYIMPFFLEMGHKKKPCPFSLYRCPEGL